MAKDRPELTEVDCEAIAESVIQRFETCYDTLWKDLRRYLIETTGLAEIPSSSPKPILKACRPKRFTGLLGGAMVAICGCENQYRP